MSIIKQRRVMNVSKAHEELVRRSASALSQLNAVLDEAIKYSAMMKKDPRSEFTAEDVTFIESQSDTVMSEISTAVEKAQDLQAMRTGTPTADEMLTKYGMTDSFNDYVNSLD